jgi:hypothetical protein
MQRLTQVESPLLEDGERQQQQQQQQQQQRMRQEQQQGQDGDPQSAISNQEIVNGDTPPPPSSGIPKHALPAHLCPLCRQPRVNPTASTSGFVFCYKCILQYVQTHGACPVTGRQCKEEQLLRLYEPNSTTTTSLP